MQVLQRAPSPTATRPNAAMKRSTLHVLSPLGRMLAVLGEEAFHRATRLTIWHALPVTFEGEAAHPNLVRWGPCQPGIQGQAGLPTTCVSFI